MSEPIPLERIIDELGDPAAYERQVDAVEVRQTHISVVFLLDDRVYKVKKPVDFGFVDYSTLERRRRFCREEVRLNRRLAPEVYRGVVPVVEGDEGLRVDDDGEPVEWAVEMVRLPDDAMLGERLECGDVGEEAVETVARRVAEFHDEADRGPEIAEYADFDAVSGNLLDNFDESRDQVGVTVHSSVFDRARRQTERALESCRDAIERRAEADVPCDTHGDLRLDHVYLFPDREPPRDLEIVDCIEFNEAFRYADPIADIAFLVMDLQAAGRRGLARTCAEAYLDASGDAEGRELLDLYVSYRAAVRAKVEGLEALEEEVPTAKRREARWRAAAHWLLALGRLAPGAERPALVLVSGLPATGKSTLADALGRRAGFRVFDSDVVRKRLAGVEPQADAGADPEEGIYSSEWSDRTYGAIRVRAEQALFAGGRVAVDATFWSESRRRAFLEMADDWGVPSLILECRASREVVRDRIRSRSDGPSDADWRVYEHLAESWEPYGPATERRVREVRAEDGVESTVDRALEILESADLL